MLLTLKSLGFICLLNINSHFPQLLERAAGFKQTACSLSPHISELWDTLHHQRYPGTMRVEEEVSWRAALFTQWWGHCPFCQSSFLSSFSWLWLSSAFLGEHTEQDSQFAVPLRLKCLFPFSEKSKSRYSELSFEKSIHPLKFMDPRFQVVPPWLCLKLQPCTTQV